MILGEDNHDHDADYLYGHSHSHAHGEEHHVHEEMEHPHHHVHRGLPEILAIIDGADMTLANGHAVNFGEASMSGAITEGLRPTDERLLAAENFMKRN